jgi:hypothetical protein
MRFLRGLPVLALALLGAAGCSEYHYFDITVSLDTTLGSNGVRGGIQRCDVTVKNDKGGIEDYFPIPDPKTGSPVCPLSYQSMGTFEYSTFKSSGSLSFTVGVYDQAMTTDACRIGSGDVSVPISSTTNAGNVTVMANGSDGCT